MEYGRCELQSYIVLCPYHIATVQAIPTQFADREPFHTIDEMKLAATQITDLVNQYDWSGYGADETLPNYLSTPSANSPFKTGIIDITSDNGWEFGNFTTDCAHNVTPILGTDMSRGLCFVLNTAKWFGTIGWMNFMCSLTSLGAFGVYLFKRWIENAMQTS
jgi:hypothetical protein